MAQGMQAKEAMRSQQKEQKVVLRSPHKYKVGAPCYALYHGPRRDNDPRWVPAIVTKVHGSRSVYVRVFPRGPVWRRHIEQLRPRYGIEEDRDPGQVSELTMPQEGPGSSEMCRERSHSMGEETDSLINLEDEVQQPIADRKRRQNPRLPTGSEFGPQNPRRSKRPRKPPERYSYLPFPRSFQGWWGGVVELIGVFLGQSITFPGMINCHNVYITDN